MSSAQAQTFHSINFGSGNTWKNTWDDWHLVPASRPLISPPEVKTSYADIEGGDGSADYTTILTSKPKYRYRTGSWSFIVINRGQVTSYDTSESYTGWAALYSEIMAFVHGKSLRVILDDDPEYYYEGRFSVSGWTSSPSSGNSSIAINYMVYPYKKKVSDSSSQRF